MQCREFRGVADSYLSDELLIETNHACLEHLENCAGCRDELAARRAVRAKLRAAFAAAPDLQVRPEFAARLRSELSDLALQRGRASWVGTHKAWLAVAACLVVAAAIGFVALQLRPVPGGIASQTAPSNQRELSGGGRDEAARRRDSQPGSAAVQSAKFEMARTAVGDHRNCAVKFRLDEKPIDLEEAGRKFDPAYINLTQAVMAEQGASAAEITLVEAHSCVYKGQRFAHIVLKHRGRIVSMLVALKPDTNNSSLAANKSSGAQESEAVTCSQFEGYQVACFETRHHAVYVVSDLDEAENLAVARRFASSVSAHIARAENAA